MAQQEQANVEVQAAALGTPAARGPEGRLLCLLQMRQQGHGGEITCPGSCISWAQV